MAAGNGPGPSGTCRSRSTGLPPGRVYSTSFWSTAAADSVAAQAIARMEMDLRMERIVSVPRGQCHGDALGSTPCQKSVETSLDAAGTSACATHLFRQQREDTFAGARDDVRGDQFAQAFHLGFAGVDGGLHGGDVAFDEHRDVAAAQLFTGQHFHRGGFQGDRKSTRLNSSPLAISYAG